MSTPTPLWRLPQQALAFVARCGVPAISIVGMLVLLLARAVVDTLAALLLAGVLAALIPGVAPVSRGNPWLSWLDHHSGGWLSPVLALVLSLAVCKVVVTPLLSAWRGRLTDRWTLQVSMAVFARELSVGSGARPDSQGHGSNLAVNQWVPRVMGSTVLVSLDLLSEVIVTGLILCVLLEREPLPSLLLIAALAVVLPASLALSRRLGRTPGAGRVRSQLLMQRWVADSVACLRELHLYQRTSAVLARYRPVAAGYARAIARERTVTEVQAPVLELLLLLALGAAVLVAGDTPGQANLQSLTLFAAMGLRLLPSLRRIAFCLQTLGFTRSYFERLGADRQPPPGAPAPAAQGATLLQCTALTFAYPGADQPVIRDLTLTAGAGEWLGVVGESGAGKSTLVDLLMGELVPQAGTVRWGLADSGRPAIGYAGASTTLIPGTLRDNVSLLGEQADSALLEALTLAGFGKVLARLGSGLDTPVEVFEQQLSGGERQRIGLARALAHAGHLLILDEATAALDQLSEQRFLQHLRTARPGLAVLLVTHRLSALQFTDRSLVLVDGIMQPFTQDHPIHQGPLGIEHTETATCT